MGLLTAKPSRVEDLPEYVKVSTRLKDIRAELAKVVAEIQADHDAQVESALARRRRLNAEAIASGATPPDAEPVAVTLPAAWVERRDTLFSASVKAQQTLNAIHENEAARRLIAATPARAAAYQQIAEGLEMLAEGLQAQEAVRNRLYEEGVPVNPLDHFYQPMRHDDAMLHLADVRRRIAELPAAPKGR